jgi:hypothetical protein
MISIEMVCRRRMKHAALLALGLLSASFWLHDSARCQTSLAAPLSLAPPTATAERSVPSVTAKDSTPVNGRLPSPKPATDYDGFSVGIIDDSEASGQTTRPVRSRPAKQSKLSQEPDSTAEQQSVDQAEDEKLKRKLTICRGCKQ